MIDIEIVFGIIAVGLLIAYSQSKNAVWGGLTIGVILGFIVVAYQVISGIGFHWLIIVRCAMWGTLIGFISELLGKVSNLISGRISR